MSNISGKADALNVITPMKPCCTWINRLVFMVSRVLPSNLEGLLGLSFIHFARWVFIKRDQWPDLGQGPQQLQYDYMLFCSNFNGTWDQYIDAFSDGIPAGLDLFWYSSEKYPGSIPLTPFKDYINHNSVETDYYYNSVPGSAQRDVKGALSVFEAIRRLQQRHAESSPQEFAKLFNQELRDQQLHLAAPGYGPVASNDTETADRNRIKFIDEWWGKDGLHTKRKEAE